MTATERSRELTILAARAASEKRGGDQVAFDVSDQLAIADTFLIITAKNERQVGAVVDAVEEALLAEQVKPLRREGHRDNRWVLLDYGDVVVHVQHAEERRLYALERLWRDCPLIDLGLPEPSEDPAAAAQT
ncbi:MAG: ribosome silencing factor [Actinomycetia bacterium]|nr:ribosome silencing factor [Actinomycetes bacterium]